MIVIATLQKPLLKTDNNLTADDFRKQEALKRSQLELLKKMPTLGFNNLLANWAFLDFVQYYGDVPARQVTGYRLLPEYFESIVKKDPRFVNAYLLLDTATTLFAGRPDVSVDLMNYGLNYLKPEQPSAYQVVAYKAVNELLFLGKTEEARKSYEMASQWAKIENTETSLTIAQRLEETAQFLAKNPDSKLARASAWLMIFSNAREDSVKKLALAKLEELGAEVTFTENSVSVKMPEDKP